MDFLVRTVTGRGQGESLETQYQGDALTLGGGGNNTLQLPSLTGQLTLRPDGKGGARLSTSGFKANVDGKPSGKARLTVGDTFSVPGYRLQLFQPPAGFDLGLELEAEGVSYAGSMDLAERIFSMRRASWLGALLVLLLFLVLPGLVLLLPDAAETLRNSPLPDDDLWISGPLAGPHATAGIAQDCQACHREAFVMVEDGACMDCHRDMTEHVDLGVHPHAEFTGVRCASCHREHNEPAMLVRADNGFCTDCHLQPQRFSAAEGMAAVAAFTAQDHPAFRLDLLTPRGPGGAHGWEVVSARQGEGELSETSNLKFNHAVHLDPEKVQQQGSGAALGCDNCHVAEDDGEHFEPITMDNHCRECHGLSFDIFEPDIELPHGDLRAAIVAMEAHFIREFTDPQLRSQRAGKKPRRIPGKREAAASCTGSGLDCGRAEALKEASYQFAETGCITCHVVLDTGAQDIMDRWVVYPVRITQDWLRGSDFDHASHLSFAAEDPDTVCLGCHDAAGSSESTDILIPDRDNCLGCHDDTRGETSVNCVGCHAFHLPGGTPALDARPGDNDPHPTPVGSQGD
ncbi:MAG: hypothetical protein CME59_09165 [Halioglobus sp.]|nr:hypothetical protein [Halioglobus sp.]